MDRITSSSIPVPTGPFWPLKSPTNWVYSTAKRQSCKGLSAPSLPTPFRSAHCRLGRSRADTWLCRRCPVPCWTLTGIDRKSTRLNSSHPSISYAVFCLKKKKKKNKKNKYKKKKKKKEKKKI